MSALQRFACPWQSSATAARSVGAMGTRRGGPSPLERSLLVEPKLHPQHKRLQARPPRHLHPHSNLLQALPQTHPLIGASPVCVANNHWVKRQSWWARKWRHRRRYWNCPTHFTMLVVPVDVLVGVEHSGRLDARGQTWHLCSLGSKGLHLAGALLGKRLRLGQCNWTW